MTDPTSSQTPDEPRENRAAQAGASAPSPARRIALVVAGAVLFLAGISSAWIIETNERDRAQAARDAHHATMVHDSHAMHVKMLTSVEFVTALTTALAAEGVDVTKADVLAALTAALAAHMTTMDPDMGAADMQSSVMEQMRRHHPEMFRR